MPTTIGNTPFEIGTTGSDTTEVDNHPMLTGIISKVGHLQINQALNVIPHLPLQAGWTGYFSVTNTGGSAIQNFQIYFPSGISGYFDASGCPATLGAGQSCSVHFNIPSNAANASGDNNKITFRAKSGTLNNQSLELPVSIAANGNIIVQQDGSELLGLIPHPGTTGSFTVFNNGKVDINNFKVNIPPAVSSYFNTNDCPSTLPSLASCSVSYNIPSGAAAVSGVTITFSGNTINENTAIPLTIKSTADIVFVQDNNHITTLSRTRSETGSFLVENQGAEDLNNIDVVTSDIFVLSNLDDNSFNLHTDCKQGATLPAGGSCAVSYGPSDGNTLPDGRDIIVSGNSGGSVGTYSKTILVKIPS